MNRRGPGFAKRCPASHDFPFPRGVLIAAESTPEAVAASRKRLWKGLSSITFFRNTEEGESWLSPSAQVDGQGSPRVHARCIGSSAPGFPMFSLIVHPSLIQYPAKRMMRPVTLGMQRYSILNVSVLSLAFCGHLKGVQSMNERTKRGGMVRLAPGDTDRIKRIGEKVGRRMAVTGTPVRPVRTTDVVGAALEIYEMLIDEELIACKPEELMRAAVANQVRSIADAFRLVGFDADVIGDPTTGTIRVNHGGEDDEPAVMHVSPLTVEGRTLQ